MEAARRTLLPDMTALPHTPQTRARPRDPRVGARIPGRVGPPEADNPGGAALWVNEGPLPASCNRAPRVAHLTCWRIKPGLPTTLRRLRRSLRGDVH
jgi:hypothetical protein